MSLIQRIKSKISDWDRRVSERVDVTAPERELASDAFKNLIADIQAKMNQPKTKR